MKKRLYQLMAVMFLLGAGTVCGDVVLDASSAKLTGDKIRLERFAKGVPEHIGYLKTGDSAEWTFFIPESGDYSFDLECAIPKNYQSNCLLYIDGIKVANAPLKATGTWDSFGHNSLEPVQLSSGKHTLRIVCKTAKEWGFNLRQIVLHKEKSPAVPVFG